MVTPEVGAAEVVRQSGGGLVVDGSPESLGKAIADLTEDSDLAHSLGSAGQRHVAKYYSWPGVAAQMESFYSSIQK